VSDYLKNLVQRAAGFESLAMIHPNIMPSVVSEMLVTINQEPISTANKQQDHIESSEESKSMSENTQYVFGYSNASNQPTRMEIENSVLSETHEETWETPSKQPTTDLSRQREAEKSRHQEFLPIELRDPAGIVKGDQTIIAKSESEVPEKRKTKPHGIEGRKEVSRPLRSMKVSADTPSNPLRVSSIPRQDHTSEQEPSSNRRKKETKLVKVQQGIKPVEVRPKAVLKPTAPRVQSYGHPRQKREKVEEHRPVHVHIGTIEVRAERKYTTPHEPENRPSFKPEGFGSYTRIRNYRNWGQ